MYAIPTNEYHRSGQDGPATRELPILFHLMDVSRPRPEARTDCADVALMVKPAETPIEAAESPEISASLPEFLQFTLAPTDFTPTPLSIPTETWTEPEPQIEPVAIVPTSIEPPSFLTETDTATTSGEIDSPSTFQIEPTPVETVAGDQTSTENTPAATPSQPVTLKSKTSDRRQRKTPASEDWFAAHGKFIAVGFVVALIGTVYLARTSRQQASPSKAATPTQSPLVDIQPPAPSVSKSPPLLATSDATKEAPAAKTPSVSAVSDSKVELHPPTAPQLVASPAAEDKSLTADKLFDFPRVKKSDERIASRPETPANTPPLSEPARPSNTQAAPTAAPAPAMPELTPAYPSTPQAAAYPVPAPGNTAYPATPAPPLVGPAAAPRAPQPGYAVAPQGPSPTQPYNRSQFPVPATPQSQAWPPPTGTNVPGAYQSPENTARGQRNERTGSGNY